MKHASKRMAALLAAGILSVVSPSPANAQTKVPFAGSTTWLGMVPVMAPGAVSVMAWSWWASVNRAPSRIMRAIPPVICGPKRSR